MTIEEIKSKGIQSIEVGIDILKKIAAAGKPLSITEISIICETSKSKLHRYLTSFIRTGILDKNQEGKYSLGTELIMLGLKASQKLNITDKAIPHLIDLKETLNETAALAIMGENGPFFVHWEEADKPINIGINAGSQVSITKSASGKIFAAFSSDKKMEEKINSELHHFGIGREEFQTSIDFIKENGYSYVKSTVVQGVNAIAAPIFNQSSQLVAALTVVGLEYSLETSADSIHVHQLKEKSALISRILGWNGN